MSELSNNTTPTTDVMDLTHLSSNMEGVNEDQASSPSSHQHPDKDVFPFFRLPRELRDNIYDLALVPRSDFTIQNPRPQRWGPPMSQEAFTPTNATTPAMATTSGVPAWFTNEYAQDNVPIFPHADIRPPPGAFLSPFLSYDELVRLRPSLHASVNFRANVNLLLTNKTVKNEYEARAKLALTLVLKDHENYAFHRVKLPPPALKVKHAKFTIIFFCHDCRMLPHFGPNTCQAAVESARHRLWIENLLPQLTELKTLTIDALLCFQGWTPADKSKLLCEEVLEDRIPKFYGMDKFTRLTLSKYDFTAQPDLQGERVKVLEWTPKGGEVKVGEKKEEEKMKDDTEGPVKEKTKTKTGTGTVNAHGEEDDDGDGDADVDGDDDGNEASGEDEDEDGTEAMNVDEADANDAGNEEDEYDAALYGLSA